MHSVMECLFFYIYPCHKRHFQINFAVVIGLPVVRKSYK